MKKTTLVVTVVLVVAIVAAISVGSMRTSEKGPPVAQQSAGAPKQANAPLFVPGQSPSFGNMMARVVVVQWFDPECEGCRAMHPLFEKIVADYSTRAHFVMRYMPFHKNSLYAASVLEEAREHGKFREALDILFDKQPEWGSHKAPRPELIPTYLTKLGIPAAKLERAAVVQKHGATIKRDESAGLAAGVRVTPTFFVNGQMLTELGDEPLRRAIDRALASLPK